MPPADLSPTYWLHADIGVAPSLIAGSGLRATTPIAAATVIVRFGGTPDSVSELGPLNHSCDPNLWWLDEHTLVARRDIAAGEEITSDYATSTDDPGLVLMCHCETYRCRQLIAGDDWQIPQLQKRYAGHWVPYLQQRIDSAQ